jgi:hypothetical protein
MFTVQQFNKLTRDVRNVKSFTLRMELQEILGSGEVNANDTVDLEKRPKEESQKEWLRIWEGSIVGKLGSDPVTPEAVKWLARRGLKA